MDVPYLARIPSPQPDMYLKLYNNGGDFIHAGCILTSSAGFFLIADSDLTIGSL
jgi:hypothetical protein